MSKQPKDIIMITDFWGVTKELKFFAVPCCFLADLVDLSADTALAWRPTVYFLPKQCPPLPAYQLPVKGENGSLDAKSRKREEKAYKKSVAAYVKEYKRTSKKAFNDASHWYYRQFLPEAKQEYQEWLNALLEDITPADRKKLARQKFFKYFIQIPAKIIGTVTIGLVKIFLNFLQMALEIVGAAAPMVESQIGDNSSSEWERQLHYQRAERMLDSFTEYQRRKKEADDGEPETESFFQEASPISIGSKKVQFHPGNILTLTDRYGDSFNLHFGMPNLLGLEKWETGYDSQFQHMPLEEPERL